MKIPAAVATLLLVVWHAEGFVARRSAPTLSKLFYQKSSQETDFLKEALTFSHLFENVEQSQVDELIEAMEPLTFKEGSTIIRQGTQNKYFYVIESGDVQYAVNGKKVGTAGTAQYFGELGTGAATVTPYG